MQIQKKATKKSAFSVLFLVVILCITLCFAGCGDSQSSSSSNSDTKKDTNATEDVGTDSIPKEGVIDLTTMKEDLMYAVIKQMADEPDRYDGREIIMEGTYQQIRDGEEGDVFHYCIVQDEEGSMNGLEFVLKDKKKYPDSVIQIRVSGTFEVYKEKGDSTKYCRIKDAKLEKVE